MLKSNERKDGLLMKKTKANGDYSSAYRKFDYNKITAPAPLYSSQPKGSVIKGKRDLRGGK